ncbi:MAG: hypothetical protein FJX61_13255 [Alphaproteobacteria bacterium]|nr:hypothetical protein [Alphaproteobacteria bacterium]
MPKSRSGTTAIRKRSLDRIPRIVLRRLSGHRTRVFLFGSCAIGDATRTSHIDIAIDPQEKLPAELMLRNLVRREGIESRGR